MFSDEKTQPKPDAKTQKSGDTKETATAAPKKDAGGFEYTDWASI
ncbi:MAG: hypothetical protein AAF762_06925 [Pseudomonadota bacterium]